MINYRNQLPLEQATPGMTLSEPLYDARGEVLLPQGATLTDAVLAALERRGVTALPIMTGNAMPLSEAELEALRQRARERIACLFRRCGAQGASGLLQRYVINLRMEQPT
ncbi:MAG TPA: hypothetical protein VEC01_11345 [Noviherbaspirillum sp.]|uniref:hypothetical protein n=1 Tax=Noviherbaspirillum sp. TaxID=1926288 RepID=UPI002D40CD74|nr:hypothetical protein [Noviherbaspirillum sp.]HYD95912.1 hypothetical protein [Noviherbaspirillum sp.]